MTSPFSAILEKYTPQQYDITRQITQLENQRQQLRDQQLAEVRAVLKSRGLIEGQGYYYRYQNNVVRFQMDISKTTGDVVFYLMSYASSYVHQMIGLDDILKLEPLS